MTDIKIRILGRTFILYNNIIIIRYNIHLMNLFSIRENI